MIPLADTHLLLPNVTIAEILPWRRIKPLADGPKWCLGLLGWRGETRAGDSVRSAEWRVSFSAAAAAVVC